MAEILTPEERALRAHQKLIAAKRAADPKDFAAAQQLIALQENINALANARTDDEVATRNALEEQVVQLKVAADQRIKQVEEAKALLEKEDKLEEAARARTEELRKQKELLSDINSLATALTGIDITSVASFTGLTTEMMKFGHELDATRVKLGQATGYTSALNKDMENLAATSAGLGLSIGDAGAVIGDLTLSMTEFAAMSKSGRAEAAKTAAELSKLGVSAQDSGRAMDILSRGMGLTEKGAIAATKQFDMLAQKVGLPTSQVVADFNQIGPHLAKFGKDGTKEFKKLTKEARSLGISVTDAFNIAEAFDTWESAADLAGKLNAQIGLQLNSIYESFRSRQDQNFARRV